MHGALPQEEWPVSALRAVINEHLSRWLARCFGGLGKSRNCALCDGHHIRKVTQLAIVEVKQPTFVATRNNAFR